MQAQRQPGSAFKPFVYAAALEAGFTPATIIDHLDEPMATPQGAWTPEDEHSTADVDDPAHGAEDVEQPRRRAPAAAGRHPADRRSTPRRWASATCPSVPSLALGSGEVTLQSMTAAYAAFANHGLVPQPILIRRVEDRDGQVLYEAQPHVDRARSATRRRS